MKVETTQKAGLSRLAVLVLLGSSTASLPAADCNRNGIDDTTDIATGLSGDCNSNGIPDECDLVAEFLVERIDYQAQDPRGSLPKSITAGDFDGDGDLDIVLTQSLFVGSLLSNSGDGTFPIQLFLPAGTNLSPGDFDGNGDLDLAVINHDSSTVTIFLNDGDASFQIADNRAVGDFPVFVTAAHLNGDDDLDVVVVNRNSDDLSVLFNVGDGTFADAMTIPVGRSPIAMAAADLDGDLDVDMAVVNHGSDDLSVLFNEGDGTFEEAKSVPLGSEPVSLVAADLDGDLDVDMVVVIQGSDGLSVLFNEGDGTFTDAMTIPVGNSPISIAAADLDGDLDVDMVVANQDSDDLSVLHNLGDGTFTEAVSSPVGRGPTSLVSEDFDRDGIPDLAVANHDSDSVSVLLNQTLPSSSRDCNANGIPDECDLELDDITPPVFTCPDDVVVRCTDPAGSIVDTNVMVKDRCDPEPVVSRSPPLGFRFPPGEHSVTVTATDASGNSSSCAFTVTVIRCTPVTLKVDQNGGGDYTAIQPAIDAALDGDTVLVADGTYTGPGNNTLDFGGKAITVASANGPETTVIDCQGATIGFLFHGGETAASVLSGFKICNASNKSRHPGGAGILCRENSSPMIMNCIMTKNTSNRGGGLACVESSSPFLINCLIVENRSVDSFTCEQNPDICLGDAGPSGVFCLGASPTFINCTIVANSFYASSSSLTMINSIVRGGFGTDNPSGAEVTYSSIGGGWPGTGNISSDPFLTANYRLSHYSPAIDAGTPSGAPETDIEGQVRPCWNSIDMGAYEYCGVEPPEPPPSPPFRRGDVDGNGDLEVTDVIKFLNYSFAGSEEAPGCLDAADVDDNGTLDVTDAINSLNFQFVGSAGPPAAPGPSACGPDVNEDAFPPCEYPAESCE